MVSPTVAAPARMSTPGVEVLIVAASAGALGAARHRSPVNANRPPWESWMSAAAIAAARAHVPNGVTACAPA